MATAVAAAESTYLKVHESLQEFDINSPLTEEELTAAGMLTVLPLAADEKTPVIKSLDDVEPEPTDVVADVINGGSYNARYAHYLRCQAISALVAFDEGWKSFEDLVLKAYVLQRSREDAEYKGDDPNKAFSLRVRKQTAEDFLKFIRVATAELILTPKPALSK